MPTKLLDRGLISGLKDLLQAVPVVILEGPRASGKTAIGTMLKDLGAIATVADLGDPTVLHAAEASPTSFVNELQTPALIDEAQLVPALATAVKRRVDRDRELGAFILTGSSRLGRTQLGGSDPLAGRAARMRVWPMTQGELAGSPVNLVDKLVSDPPGPAPVGADLTRSDLLYRIRRGGLPLLAGVAAPVQPQLRWQLAQEYVEGVLYHEVGGRHDRAELQRLFRYLAASTARLANISTIANEMASTRSTVMQRLAALEACFLVHQVAGHRPAEHRTLTAHPKIHAIDLALAAWAARIDDEPSATLVGALVETFVVNELAAQAGWLYGRTIVRHWRDTARKLEVDALLLNEQGDSVAIEIKASTDVHPGDLKGLACCLESVHGTKRGLVFYTGARTLQLDDKIWAVPISTLWTGFAKSRRAR